MNESMIVFGLQGKGHRSWRTLWRKTPDMYGVSYPVMAGWVTLEVKFRVDGDVLEIDHVSGCAVGENR